MAEQLEQMTEVTRHTVLVDEPHYFRLLEGASGEIDGTVVTVAEEWDLSPEAVILIRKLFVGHFLPDAMCRELTLRFTRK